ncbi:MAG TPA: LacI family DNA-binding transcriptional regulator [Verrucomicrobiae bacterium]|nr:LacI family DNA-binding transcriptional regulator [Verrucomicrobiae bacterium]
MQPDLPKPRVTLRDVARRLNVSHTTISRALRNDPEISKAMRERVQSIAREMGYKPDPMLNALAHYRRSRNQTPVAAELAWINHWPNPKKLWSFKEFSLYWKGAFEEAERCGFRLEEFTLDNGMSLDRLGKILHARNIRGILLPPRGDTSPNYHQFDWDDFCIVRFGHSIPFPHAHLVSSDQLTDGLIAFENMWTNGYRRIGLVTSSKMHTRFSAGFFFSQMKWSPNTRLPALVVTQDQTEQDEQLLKSWLRKNKPDAILTDVRELRDLLLKVGYKVPKNIGLAALSVLDGNADAGIDQNSEEIGRVAIQLLISLINHNEGGIPKICREVLVEGNWVNGSTLPPKN